MTVPEGHDRAAKRLLGDTRMIADALRAFVPGSWVSRLDLDTLRPLPAEHVNAELHRRRGDLLWTAEFNGGGAVVIILEAQSTPDSRMPARMMTLTGLVCEGLTDGGHGAGRQGAGGAAYRAVHRPAPLDAGIGFNGAGRAACGAVGLRCRTALSPA